MAAMNDNTQKLIRLIAGSCWESDVSLSDLQHAVERAYCKARDEAPKTVRVADFDERDLRSTLTGCG